MRILCHAARESRIGGFSLKRFFERFSASAREKTPVYPALIGRGKEAWVPSEKARGFLDGEKAPTL
jgi:hypothetical protein